MSYRALQLLLSIFLTTSAALGQTCQPLPSSYTALDLGTLGGDYAVGTAINEAGNIAGYSRLAGNGATAAFLWSPSTGMQNLGRIGGDTFAQGINASGNVVGYGYVQNSSFIQRSFLWTPATGFLHPHLLSGDNESIDYAIDDQNRSVGVSLHLVGSYHAVLWTGTTVHQLLDTSNSGFQYAFGITSNSLKVVGTDGVQGILWTKSAPLLHLGTLVTGETSTALAINHGGTIVAGYETNQARSDTTPLIWTFDPNNGQPIIQAIGAHGTTNAVNDVCQAVGEVGYAFVWTAQSGLIDLNTLVSGLPVPLDNALAINNSGQIVATAPVNGVGYPHTYLLTPVP
jgi:probable HAF family extracellular repeat protein